MLKKPKLVCGIQHMSHDGVFGGPDIVSDLKLARILVAGMVYAVVLSFFFSVSASKLSMA